MKLKGTKLIVDVPSESRDLTHEVAYDMATQEWSCGCEHYHYRRVFCKHMDKAMGEIERLNLYIPLTTDVDTVSDIPLTTQKVAVEVEDVTAIESIGKITELLGEISEMGEIAEIPVEVKGVPVGVIGDGVEIGRVSDLGLAVVSACNPTKEDVDDKPVIVGTYPVVVGVERVRKVNSLLAIKRELIELQKEYNNHMNMVIGMIDELL